MRVKRDLSDHLAQLIYFTDKETETFRSEKTCPKSHGVD